MLLKARIEYVHTVLHTEKFFEWGQKLILKDYAGHHKGVFCAVPIGKLTFKGAGVELELSIGRQMALSPLLNETIVIILKQLLYMYYTGISVIILLQLHGCTCLLIIMQYCVGWLSTNSNVQ